MKCRGRETDLFKPRVKISSGHEQHPERQAHDTQRKLPTNTQVPLMRFGRVISLDPRALQGPVAHDDGAIISAAHDLRARSQDDPDDLLGEEAASQDKQEHMSGDIVSAVPVPAGRPARRGSEQLLLVGRARGDGVARNLAPAPGEPEPAIDEGRAEAPLRDEDPPAGDEGPAGRGPGGHPAAPERRVRGDEGEERDRDPQPPALDEEDVEQVVFSRKVRRRERLDVGLPREIVGRPAGFGGQRREQRAEDQDRGVHGEEEGFEGRGQEWRAACCCRCRCCCCHCGRFGCGRGGAVDVAAASHPGFSRSEGAVVFSHWKPRRCIEYVLQGSR